MIHRTTDKYHLFLYLPLYFEDTITRPSSGNRPLKVIMLPIVCNFWRYTT